MEDNYWVRFCTDCPLCRYTRGCKEPTIFYHLARMIEKVCPFCYMANKRLKKDFSRFSGSRFCGTKSDFLK